MNASKYPRDIAAVYIQENFGLDDRLAVILLNKRSHSVIQRLAPAGSMASADFQDWIADHNRRHYDVYISMNALGPDATGRTKADVHAIRHVYLDIDEEGTAAVETLLRRTDLPKPNYLINSSPDKWQVIWKVEGFGKEQAEELQKGLARECGADPAATDCARVLRLPPYVNHKYARLYPVLIQPLAGKTEIYRPEHFPAMAPQCPIYQEGLGTYLRRVGPKGASLSQSERDWAFAKRALARGDSPGLIAAAIAQYRRNDKHNPQYYAELTVRKAVEALKTGPARDVVVEPERH